MNAVYVIFLYDPFHYSTQVTNLIVLSFYSAVKFLPRAGSCVTLREMCFAR